jgi:hypothetical protein
MLVRFVTTPMLLFRAVSYATVARVILTVSVTTKTGSLPMRSCVCLCWNMSLDLQIGALVVGGVLYLVLDIDLLPERALGVIGYLDDVIVVLMVAGFIGMVLRSVVLERMQAA